MLKIVTVPSKILSTPTKTVSVVDRYIKKICLDMIDTLKKLDNPKGVGLAANQINIPLSIFVFRDKKNIRPIINPRLLSHSDNLSLDQRGKNIMLEGCLSIPYYYGTVKRFNKVKIAFLDRSGKECEEEFSVPEAVIIQHEMDHLAGKLFVEKLLEQKGDLYKIDKTDKEKSLVEVDI